MNEEKTREQLLDELAELRQRVVELEAAEEALRESEELYRSVVESVGLGLNLIDRDHNIVMINAEQGRHFSKSPREVVGRKCFREFEKRDTVCPHCPGVEAIATGRPAEVETEGVRDDGSRFLVRLRAFPVFERDGTVKGFVEVGQDITQRRKAEDALRESEKRFRRLVEHSTDGFFLHGLDGRIIDVNQQACESLGYTREELLGLSIQDIEVEPVSGERLEKWKQMVPGVPITLEGIHERKDGTTFRVEARLRIVESGERQLILSLARDITERKQAEEALKRGEERYALAQRVANIGSWDWDILTGDLHWSDRIEPLFGFGPGEFGATYEAFLECIHPEDRQYVIESVDACVEGGKDYAIEHRIVWPDGTVRWVSETGDVIRDESGKAIRMLGIVQDITGRKQAEEDLRRYATELEARNEELDAFAHTVAHDLKNPLGLVIGYAGVLEKGHTALSPENLYEYLHIISTNGRKMNRIIDELLLLSELRQVEVELDVLDMAGIVAEARQRLNDMVKQYRADIILPETWPGALGHGPWVEEVWVNYLSNAIKYGGQPPRVELGAEAQPDDAAPPTVRFWVRDNGPGLTPEEQSRLFTPFTRLDQVQAKGHGLGLSIVRRIVEKLGGQVGVESETGQGSTFTFTLPVARSRSEGAQQP